MSFIFATRVAIPFDPTSHVPKFFCGWEPWGTHLGDPKGKGPPGAFRRQETQTAPQGPAVTAEPGWSAVTAPLTSLGGNFSLLACDSQGSASCSRGPPSQTCPCPCPASPRLDHSGGATFLMLASLEPLLFHKEQKQKVNWTKGKLWLLCWP